jgi:hypothetical protein
LDTGDDVAAGTERSLDDLYADSRIRLRQSTSWRSSVVACASCCDSTVDTIACALASPSPVGVVVAIAGRMAIGSACSCAASLAIAVTVAMG